MFWVHTRRFNLFDEGCSWCACWALLSNKDTVRRKCMLKLNLLACLAEAQRQSQTQNAATIWGFVFCIDAKRGNNCNLQGFVFCIQFCFSGAITLLFMMCLLGLVLSANNGNVFIKQYATPEYVRNSDSKVAFGASLTNSTPMAKQCLHIIDTDTVDSMDIFSAFYLPRRV